MAKREWRLAGKVVPVSRVRDEVFRRDRDCLLAVYESTYKVPHAQRHVCNFHLHKTLEHVTGVHGAADVRRDDERHTVALCLAVNGGTMRLAPHEAREWFREGLRMRYPSCQP